jgi:excisionase family DNA binding protein
VQTPHVIVNLDPEQRPTLSVDEAAFVLGVSRGSAYQAIRNGEIPVIGLGKRLRVPTAALRRMLALDDVPAAS